MNMVSKILCTGLLTFFLQACSEGAGPLEGKWKMSGIPMTVIYRDNEEEAMGGISEVEYEHQGNDVLITYKSGMAEGTKVRITMTGTNSAKTAFGKLTRTN
jgi:hypothetical protein